MKRAARRPGRALGIGGRAGALTTVAAVMVAGLGVVSPAQAAPGLDCPEAFPVGSLVKDQPLTGLTVAEGTTPEEFSGEVIGVLDDGIALGVDMILVRLSSPEIDRVGVWSGMSGSPVYAENGQLVGAVSYTLTWGATSVAGVTPAADMAAVLARRGVQGLGVEAEVSIPDRLQNQLVALGDATAAQAESGMAPLRLPLGISGLGAQRRYNQISKSLDRAGKSDGFRVVRMGAAGAGDLDASDIVAGGNLAAAISYGDVSYAALGTATMVCGQDVVGFGHPFWWTGPASLSMHPAEALLIQEDAGYSGFKVGTIGGSVGTIDEDRIAGIAGSMGPAPDHSTITTSVTSEARSRDGSTEVYLSDWVPDVAVSALLANEDGVFDGIGKGSGQLSWTVAGRREDGSPFSLTRSDVYADRYDLTWATIDDLYSALAQIEYNGVEDVSVSAVDAEADLSRAYDHAQIKKVHVKKGGTWRRLRADAPRVSLRIGKVYKFRVTMRTTEGLTSQVVRMPIRRRDLGQLGRIKFKGGNSGSYNGDFYYFDEEGSTGSKQTFDELLAGIEDEARNDDVVANLRFRGLDKSGKAITRERRVATGTVTDGSVSIRVRIVRGGK